MKQTTKADLPKSSKAVVDDDYQIDEEKEMASGGNKNPNIRGMTQVVKLAFQVMILILLVNYTHSQFCSIFFPKIQTV